MEYLAPYGFTSPQMTFVRGTVAFACMFLYMLIRDRGLVKTNIKELMLFMGCGLVSGIIGGLKFDALGIAIGFTSGISYKVLIR